jgi:hypothetical protein
LNSDLKQFGEWIVVNFHDAAGNDHVASTTDWQKFSQSLNNSEYNAFYNCHLCFLWL